VLLADAGPAKLLMAVAMADLLGSPLVLAPVDRRDALRRARSGAHA